MSTTIINGILSAALLKLWTSNAFSVAAKKNGSLALLMALLIIPWFRSLSPSDSSKSEFSFYNTIFGNLGIHIKNPAIIIKDDLKRHISNLNDTLDLKIPLCKLDADQYLVAGLDIMWHGPGSKTLLQHYKSMRHQAPIQIQADSNMISIFKNPQRLCSDLPTAIYFQPVGNNITNEQYINTLATDYIDTFRAMQDMDIDWEIDRAEFITRLKLSAKNKEIQLKDDIAMAACRALEIKLGLLNFDANNHKLDCKFIFLKTITETYSNIAETKCQTQGQPISTECKSVSVRLHFKKRDRNLVK